MTLGATKEVDQIGDSDDTHEPLGGSINKKDMAINFQNAKLHLTIGPGGHCYPIYHVT